ncbi:MAG: hypothetical protein COB16_07875 [Rhodobacteraceae bacterium]|nr:MAG: hypothetical protein COB16_07875 [Paracoccaceae bacterium]
MQKLGDSLYHLRLLGRMGQTVGADLAQAFNADRIDNKAWAVMINNCRACPSPQRCHAWLTANDQASSPLRGCRNAETLLRLKRAAEKDKKV